MSETTQLREAFASAESRTDRTVVVVDVVDSTAMKEQQAEVTWLNSLGWMYDTVTTIVAEAVPDVAVKYLGDGIMLVFDGHHRTEAVNIAIEVQEAITEAGKSNGGGKGLIDFACSVGISTGEVVGFTTPSGSPDFVGAVVDKAFWLSSTANAKAIFVDTATLGAANTTRIKSVFGSAINRTPDQYQGEVQKAPLKSSRDPVAYHEILWSQHRYGMRCASTTTSMDRLQAVPTTNPNPSRMERTELYGGLAMRDKRLPNDTQDMSHKDSLADQYIEQYLEYLDGERPTLPSMEGLSAKELSDVEGALKVLKVHQGSRSSEGARKPTTSTTPPDVVVAYHSADRGWANWISYELQNVGYRCRADALDLASDSNGLALPHPMQMIVVVSTRYLTADTNWPASPRATRTTFDAGRFIAVRVDDCDMPKLDPGQWIDLTASTEHAAREALLQKVARAQPALRMVTAGPRYRSPVELLLQQLGREHQTASALLELCMRSQPENDHLASGPAQPSKAASNPPHRTLTPLWLTNSLASELVPPTMRTAIGGLLSDDACERVSEVAVEMLNLAEVKRKLHNIAEAERAFHQAEAINAVAQELGRRNLQASTCRCDCRNLNPCLAD